MRLIIVRHGDPNYEIDSLTEKGWREAEFLSVRMEKQLQKEHTYIYTSPLGRAKDTASLTLKKLGMTATEFKWLREFEAPAIDEDTGTYKVCWDLLPATFSQECTRQQRSRRSVLANVRRCLRRRGSSIR